MSISNYRYYMYSYISDWIVLIDTQDKKIKNFRFNEDGRCWLVSEWEEIKQKDLNRAVREKDRGYNRAVLDHYYLIHFTKYEMEEYESYKKCLFKSNDEEECIKFAYRHGISSNIDSILKLDSINIDRYLSNVFPIFEQECHEVLRRDLKSFIDEAIQVCEMDSINNLSFLDTHIRCDFKDKITEKYYEAYHDFKYSMEQDSEDTKGFNIAGTILHFKDIIKRENNMFIKFEELKNYFYERYEQEKQRETEVSEEDEESI